MTGRTCPICRYVDSTQLANLNYVLPEGSSLPQRTVLKLCRRCGFAYVDSDSSEASYLQHYMRDSLYADVKRAGSGVQEHDRNRLRRAAERLAPWLKPQDLLIDVGASTGGMLSVAAETLSVRALGIDPDQHCVDVMQSKGFEARRGSLADLPLDLHGTAAAVCLSHVLEHLWDPARDLALAAELLSDGGVIYVETPDSSGYSSNPNVWRYYLDPEHINHFQPNDFALLASQIQLVVLESGSATLSLEDGTPYPIGWAILKRANKIGVNMATIEQARVPHPIERYLEQQQKSSDEWRSRLDKAQTSATTPMLVWGTGSHAQRVLGAGLIEPGAIAAFIDSDPGKQGKSLIGRPIMTPEQAFEAYPNTRIVVLAGRAAAHSIGKSLTASGRAQDAEFLD